VNSVAAHDCCRPGDPRTFAAGDVAKVDLGVHVDGCIADTAATADLGDHADLLCASRTALEAAIALVRPGTGTRQIGAAIQRAMQDAGHKPVANLTGHGIAPYTIHCSPAIPNVPDGTDVRLKEGMMICIEPFATTGRGTVVEQGRAEVFGARRKLKAPAAGSTRASVEPDRGAQGPALLPPRARARARRGAAPSAACASCCAPGAVFEYPPLCERPGALVAQFEHTMYVGPDGAEVMTR
jgi:methionyl aminopeptidase